jgi:excisionase family DNA binding protein
MTKHEIEWVGTTEAARLLGVTPRTVYRLIDEGDLPAYKFGRVIRLQRAEIEEFIAGSRIRPGSLEHLYPEPRPERSGSDAGSDSSVSASNAT